MKTSFLSLLTDRQLDELLSHLVEARRLLCLGDSISKSLEDSDYLNLLQTQIRVFNEIQRRAKLTL